MQIGYCINRPKRELKLTESNWLLFQLTAGFLIAHTIIDFIIQWTVNYNDLTNLVIIRSESFNRNGKDSSRKVFFLKPLINCLWNLKWWKLMSQNLNTISNIRVLQTYHGCLIISSLINIGMVFYKLVEHIDCWILNGSSYSFRPCFRFTHCKSKLIPTEAHVL